MKNSSKILIPVVLAWFAAVSAVSCMSILEKPSGSDITIDTIYSNRQYAESALYEVYYYLVPKGFPLGNGNLSEAGYTNNYKYGYFTRSILASITDEGCNTRGATAGWYVNDGGFDSICSSRNQEDSFPFRWPGIRAAWTFVDNIDRVDDIPEAEREQMKAEAKALVALAYLDMFPRYGGLPIVDKVLGQDDTNLMIPRASLQETIDFIVGLCDEAIPLLPDSYASSMRGRLTKGAALCIKARTLLYAASPLFNCAAQDMIMNYDHPELLCLMGYDKERWLKAAEANAAVLDWAAGAGVSLISAEDIEGGESDPKHNAYGYATSVNDNREVILAFKGYTDSNNGFGDGIYWKFTSRGLSVMFNIMKYFRKADGSDQDWPTVVGERRPFAEYEKMMNEMEPRFLQCVWPAGQAAPNFTGTGNYAKWPFGSIDDQMGTSDMYGVGPLVKFHYNYNTSENMKDWIVFRLAEFYLNYAEAVNQYYGSPTASCPGAKYTAEQAVNVIRERGGIRPLNSAEASGKDAFQQQIVRERAVELFAEGHRWWDCKRWKIAGDTFGGTLYTIRYVQDVAGSKATSYTQYYLAEHHKQRVWTNAMYFYPFPQEEVDKGYLFQNPGY